MYQGHKTNVIGRTENLEEIPELIREDVGKRWAGSVEIHVGEEMVTVGVNSAIAIHYKVSKLPVGPRAQGESI